MNTARAEWSMWARTLPFVLLVRLLVFQWFHLYVGLWRYVSMRDIVEYIVDLFPRSVLTLPPSPELSISRTREGA